MATPCCPEGPAGNHTLVNQDERAILQAQIAAVTTERTALSDEDDSHVTPGFRDGDVAGS
jgi:hypothetical protein